MQESQRYELTKSDYRKNWIMPRAAAASPILLALPLPILFVAMYALLGTTTSAAAFYLFMALITGVAGFALGLIVMLILFWRRAAWLKDLRERMAVDGIKTGEVDWFKNELSSEEKRALKELDKSDRLLADAYRETLASRLTASRILKSTRDELLLVQRRQNKLKYLTGENTQNLQQELTADKERLETVRGEADALLTEARTRLETIAAAARRGTQLAGNEQALKQLTERTADLPLALEAARLEDQIRRELDHEENGGKR